MSATNLSRRTSGKKDKQIKSFYSKKGESKGDEYELVSATEYGNTEGDIVESLILSDFFKEFSPEFLNRVMEGKIDTSYLKEKYPQMKNEEIDSLVQAFSEYCRAVDNDLIQKNDSQKDVLSVKQCQWVPLVNTLDEAESCDDGCKDVKLSCNVVGCSNFVRFSPEKVKEIQKLENADPRDFMCERCNKEW